MGKQLLPLTFLLLLVAAAGYFLTLDPKPTAVEKGLLFNDLAEQANQIRQIRLSNHQGLLLDAGLQQDRWVANGVLQVGTYPLEHNKLTQLVQSLMQASLYQAKTAKPENYVRLGLQDIDAQDSQAILVELIANDTSWAVLVGSKAPSGENYIRLPQQAQSWLLDQQVVLPLDANEWLKQPILDIATQDIGKLSRIDSKRWNIELSDSEAGGYALSPMPKDRGLKYDSILHSTVAALTTLNFDQIQPQDEGFWRTLKLSAKFELITLGGDKITAELTEKDKEYFIRFYSQSLQAYWQNWIYKLSGFSAGQLNKEVNDFLLEPDSEVESLEPQKVDEGESPL
jgi:hypothetical protein